MGLDDGATIGYFTSGPNGYTADWRDHLFVHEYGHYIQSQRHGPAYFFTVGIPSIESGAIYKISNGKIKHRTRWFEADASNKGSTYFDKYYGSGKDGYVEGNADYFDINSFANDIDSEYTNPRDPESNKTAYPTSGSFHWTDVPIMAVSLGLLVILLSL